MSAENVEFVRQALEAINRVVGEDPGSFDLERDAPEVWERIDPAFELHQRADAPGARIYRGREESKAFWQEVSEIFGEVRWEPREFIDLDHAVVVRSRIVAKGLGSGAPAELDETDVCWFRDGRIIRLRPFADDDEALAAAREPV